MEACSGEHGLRLFQEKGFDLVLTDLGMPSLSGWEVWEHGLRLFQEKGFDLVLTDLGMPSLSGWEVCTKPSRR